MIRFVFLFMVVCTLLIILMRPRSVRQALRYLFGDGMGRLLSEFLDRTVGTVKRCAAACLYVSEGWRAGNKAVQHGIFVVACIALMPVATYVAIRYTNSESTPILMAIWLPAALTYPIALRNLKLAVSGPDNMVKISETVFDGVHRWSGDQAVGRLGR